MLDNDIAYMNSYLESRGGTFNKVYFFGLQYILKEYLTTPITQADLDYAFPILDTIGTG
jgi:nicotinamide phosphoribosyltransferase